MSTIGDCATCINLLEISTINFTLTFNKFSIVITHFGMVTQGHLIRYGMVSEHTYVRYYSEGIQQQTYPLHRQELFDSVSVSDVNWSYTVVM